MFACSVKVSYASDSATKAVLLKDKPARSVQEDSPTDPLQYIEVGKVPGAPLTQRLLLAVIPVLLVSCLE